jgi:hypothetical protein
VKGGEKAAILVKECLSRKMLTSPLVILGLDPRIHPSVPPLPVAWILGSSPRMTEERDKPNKARLQATKNPARRPGFVLVRSAVAY